MSIPRRARIFGQPTKLQRDDLIGGQDIIYTKKELYSIPGPGHTNPAATNHLFLNASRKRPASGSYLSRVERIKTSKREYLKKMKSPHWKKRYVLQGIDEIRKLLPKNKYFANRFRQIDIATNCICNIKTNFLCECRTGQISKKDFFTLLHKMNLHDQIKLE